MMYSPEIWWGVGTVVLLLAFVWAIFRYRSRNPANDRVTDEAAKALYEHPETYPEKREELKKKLQ